MGCVYETENYIRSWSSFKLGTFTLLLNISINTIKLPYPSSLLFELLHSRYTVYSNINHVRGRVIHSFPNMEVNPSSYLYACQTQFKISEKSRGGAEVHYILTIHHFVAEATSCSGA